MALLALAPNGNTMIARIMGGYGISMDATYPFVLLVNASSLNNGTVLQCTSVASEVATLSPSVVIHVFGKWQLIYVTIALHTRQLKALHIIWRSYP